MLIFIKTQILGKRFPWFLFLFTLGIRLFFISTLNQEYHWPDEIDYDVMARRILEGKGYGLWSLRGPLYSFVLAVIYLVNGINFLAVRIFQSLLDSTTTLILFQLGRILFNHKAGMITGLLYSIYPFAIYFTGILLSENLYIFLLVCTILLGIRYQKDMQIKNLAFFGVSLGLLILCRPVAMIYLIPFMLWVMYLQYCKDISYKKIFLFGLCFLLFTLSTVAPWTYRNYLVHDKFIFVSTGSGRMFWAGNGPEATLNGSIVMSETINKKLLTLGGNEPSQEDFNFPEAKAYMNQHIDLFNNVYINYERNQYLFNETIAYIIDNPIRFMSNYIKKIVLFWSPISFSKTINDYSTISNKWIGSFAYTFIFIFFILGVLKERNNIQQHFLLYLVLIIYMLVIALFSTTIRFRIPIDPCLMLFAGTALQEFITRFYNRFIMDVRQ